MIDKIQTDLRKIKAEAKKELSHIPGVMGFGIGEKSLRIYIINYDVKKQLPEEFKGVAIDFIITGEIAPAI
jgi:hypothetical protein